MEISRKLLNTWDSPGVTVYSKIHYVFPVGGDAKTDVHTESMAAKNVTFISRRFSLKLTRNHRGDRHRTEK